MENNITILRVNPDVRVSSNSNAANRSTPDQPEIRQIPPVESQPNKTKDLPPTRATIIPCLSGLRGVAALSVVYLHQNSYDHGQHVMGGWDTMYEFGSIGVIFFFVLSAFLLTYRGLYDIKRESDVIYYTIPFYNYKIPVLSLRWISYFIRRIFRIYPVYIVIVILATSLPRFQGDDFQKQAYYSDGNGTALPPSDILPYAVFYNVQSIFWTIPPEFEYYFVIPFIILTFEIAQHLDQTFFVSKKEQQENFKVIPNQETHVQYLIRLVKDLMKRMIFRSIHMVFWTWLALPGVLDTYWWYEGVFNKHHLPPHYFRFWVGSQTAILLYLLEQNHLVPKPITPEEQKSTERQVVYSRRLKKILFVLCDISLWSIIAYTISQFPWYQGNYFGNDNITISADWPDEWSTNSTYVVIHGNVYDESWFDQEFVTTRLCAYLCGTLVFLVCFGGRTGSFSSVFLWDFFMYAGDVSFPLYLCHFIGLREYQRLWRDYINSTTGLILLDNLFAGILMSLLVASVVHHVVEQPCVKVGPVLVRYLRSSVFKPKETNIEIEQPKEDKRVSQRFSQHIIPENLDDFVKRRSQRLSKIDFSQFNLPDDDESSGIDSVGVEGRDSLDHHPPQIEDHSYGSESPHRTLSYLDRLRSRGSRLLPSSMLREEIHISAQKDDLPLSRSNSVQSGLSNIVRKGSGRSSLISKNVSSISNERNTSQTSSVYSFRTNDSSEFHSISQVSNERRLTSELLDFDFEEELEKQL
ncbi:hypothetical protein HDV06_002371 [Boothiomyces sp. JEL0866]|nr:hypothetical protein HDV06_002371 [Boothiomyces sp. JEL0866]